MCCHPRSYNEVLNEFQIVITHVHNNRGNLVLRNVMLTSTGMMLFVSERTIKGCPLECAFDDTGNHTQDSSVDSDFSDSTLRMPICVNVPASSIVSSSKELYSQRVAMAQSVVCCKHSPSLVSMSEHLTKVQITEDELDLDKFCL